MNNYILTCAGCDFIAGCVTNPGVTPNVMYAIYTNEDNRNIDVTKESNIGDLLNNGIIRSTSNVVRYTLSEDDRYKGNIAVFSTIINRDDLVVSNNSPELIPGTSKIIAVALGLTGNSPDISGDTLLAVSSLKTPSMWVDNMNMTITCPIVFNGFDGEVL